jgi:hypothetical protein
MHCNQLSTTTFLTYLVTLLTGISPTEAEDFSSSPCVQTGSGAHPASCPVGAGGPFPGGKARPGRGADPSPPSSAEVKYEEELYLLSPYVPPWRAAGQLCFALLLLAMRWRHYLANLYVLCDLMKYGESLSVNVKYSWIFKTS